MKGFKMFVYITMIVLVISFIIIEALIINEVIKSGKDDVTHKEVDYVIVLGARLYGSTPSPALHERLIITAKYINNTAINQDILVIVTGGQGEDEDIPESHAMKEFLKNQGIQDNRIITEEESTSTYENLKFAQEIIKERDKAEEHSILIVTSDFHMLRAKLIGERLGFNVYGLPAETPRIIKLKSYIREYFAVIKSLIFDRN